MENHEAKEDSQKPNMLHRRKSSRKEEARNEESVDKKEEEEEEEPVLTRWRKIYSFIPKTKSCFLISGVLMGESIVETAVTGLLITFLIYERTDKLTTAAMIVNLVEVMSSLLSLPAIYYKDKYNGCYYLTIISSLSYSMGLWFMCISAFSRTKLCHTILPHKDWCHKIESPLFYIALVLVALGKAGFGSSCVVDFLEHQVEAKLNEQDKESDSAIKNQRKLVMEKNKYEREAAKDNGNRKISIDNMKREEKIRISVTILSNTFDIFGVILGNMTVLFLGSWAIRSAVSTGVLLFTLSLFLMGSASFVYCGHCYNTKREGGCNTKNTYPVVKPAVNGNNTNNISKLSDTNDKTLLLRMVPICFTFIMYGVVKSTVKSFFLEQGENMDGALGPIQSVPLPILLTIGNVLGMCVTSLVKEVFYKRFREDEKIYGILIRIGFGLICSCICCGTARWSENRRLEVVRENGLQDDSTHATPLTVFYLFPQFISYGAMKHLSGTGLEVFFENELPESMGGYASGLADSVIGIAIFFGAMAVPITQKLSILFGGSSTGWFADTINHSHLDYFYTVLSIFCLLNLPLYAYVSTRYVQKRPSPDTRYVQMKPSPDKEVEDP